MKKIILSMMFAGSVAATFAQLAPSLDGESMNNGCCGVANGYRWLVYGDFGFDNQSTSGSNSGTNNTNWNINPGIGYHINDMFTVGVQGSMNYTNLDLSTYANPNRTQTWTLGGFFRYNCCEFGKVFSCYTQLNVGYYEVDAYSDNNPVIFLSTNNAYGNNQVQNGSGVMAMVYPALGVKVGHGFSLDLNLGGIGYSRLTQDHTNLKNYDFNLTFGQQIKIGLSKDFNCGMHHHNRMHKMSEPGEDYHTRSVERMSGDDEDESPRKSKARIVRDMDDE